MGFALFYPAELGPRGRSLLVERVLEQVLIDVVDFPDEVGGDVNRELAIPFLEDMDEVIVQEASFQLQARSRATDISGYAVTQGSVANAGLILRLNQVSRLREVEFSAAPLPSPPNQTHFVVRPVAPDNSIGPPIFAHPSFALPSPMYGPVLGGLENPGGGPVIRFPNVLGQAWLFQLATGDKATELSPVAFPMTIRRVQIDAAPKNLSVQFAANPPIALWQHPDILLPETGKQPVSFTPVAQKQLSSAMASARVTLPVPLKFHTDAGGSIEITQKTLTARYVAKPLPVDPQKLRLSGSWIPLSLIAPAGRRPVASSAQLTAKLLGRELNGGSPVPPATRPVSGLRVRGETWVATAVPFGPPVPGPAGRPLPLVSVRAYLEATEDAEVVLQTHTDAAGIPGPTAARPVVKQLGRGFSAWVEFELASPLLVMAAGSPVWVVLRVNKGEIYWSSGGLGTARLTLDQGKSWGEIEPTLAPTAAPLAQLFHASPEPLALPAIRAQIGGTVISENIFADAVRKGDKEFVVGTFQLPPGAISRLAAATGTGRVTTLIHLFSRTALDLTVENMLLFYDPFGTATR